MIENSIEAIKGGRPVTPNRQGLYSKAAKHAALAIDTLVDLLHSPNENVQLGAAKALLDKCLPDLKAIDAFIKEEVEGPMEIKFVLDENIDRAQHGEPG